MVLIKRWGVAFFVIITLFSCKSKYINDRIEDSINAEDNSGSICLEEIQNFIFYKKCGKRLFQCGIRKSDIINENVLPFELYRFSSIGALDTLIPVIEQFYQQNKEADISSIATSSLEYHFKIRFNNNSHSISYNRKNMKWNEMKEGWK